LQPEYDSTMKALILAAGFGTRLGPHTEARPKPLFTIDGEPVIARLIARLIHAGCSSIIINTHHLHGQIETFIEHQSYSIPVTTRYEPVILGTGGAMRNVSDFLDTTAFLLINSDIVTDLDFRALYTYHCRHAYPVTLVMHDHAEFNSVAVDESGFIRSFKPDALAEGHQPMAFTGIQVADPRVLKWIPSDGPVSSIDVYQTLLDRGYAIKAYIPADFYWQDIGTPQRYLAAALDHMAPRAFLEAFHFKPPATEIQRITLRGDGSDRSWHRVFAEDKTLIIADHGIQAQPALSEIDSFIRIGMHLYEKGLPVPKIFLHDRFSGLVFLQDLGDTDLYQWVHQNPDPGERIRIYQRIIEALLQMAVRGAQDFDPAICYQSPSYDKPLILEKECRYFVDAFLNGYLGFNTAYAGALAGEFALLADIVLENQVSGFMHRDLQSRNIMIKDQALYFIDFQAGRIGPIQYDLAALLADPYVDLPPGIQENLITFAVETLQKHRMFDNHRFLQGYAACRLTRALQTLGAFGFLTTVKQKPFFAPFIPVALRNLDRQLAAMRPGQLPALTGVVRKALSQVDRLFATGLDV